MSTLNRRYVLEPFDNLIATCQSTVLLGLRLLENVRAFPAPTVEECQFFRFVPGQRPCDFTSSKAHFKRWILLKGLGDIHQCISTALQRFIFVIKSENEPTPKPTLHNAPRRRILPEDTLSWSFPKLIEEASALCPEPLGLQEPMKSLNRARNCLEHGSGKVIAKFCNCPQRKSLIISGRRFRMFYRQGDQEVPAALGAPGPENSALLLGAEDFEIHFALGQSLDMSLKHFVDVLNTCVFLRADLDQKLSEREAARTVPARPV